MKLSIITVTYNNEKTISGYLNSVFKHLPSSTEVIIVDSGSTDQTVETLRQEIKVKGYRSVEILEKGENVGFGRGCNLGARKAEGEFFLFLNPDTKVLDDSINKLLRLIEKDSSFGIVAPKLIEEAGRVQKSVRKLPTVWGAIGEFFLGMKGAYEAYVPGSVGPIEVEAVFGAVMLIRRQTFEKVGGFDRRYFMYFEDLDLCRKVRALGLKIIYDPNAEFMHKVGGSYNENKERWSKESDKIYHGNFTYAVLSLIYFLNRIKNRLSK